MLLTLTLILLAVLFAYFKWSYRYWTSRNVPQLSPIIPYGNAKGIFNDEYGEYMPFIHAHQMFRSQGHKHGGLYVLTTPAYMPIDLQYVKNILVADSQYFIDRGVYLNEKVDPLSAHLLSLGGLKWKRLRTKLTPTFSSGKMKTMLGTILACADEMVAAVGSSHEINMDVKEIMARYTTDVIGSCAFGLECDSFKNTDSIFRKYGRQFLQSNKIRHFGRLITTSYPKLCQNLGLKTIPKVAASFFIKMITDTIKYRESNDVSRNDVLQILIDLKNSNESRPLTVGEICAQAFAFFVGGFETSSTTLSFCLFELARHENIQEKVREEIIEVLNRYDGTMTYESLKEMTYLRQIFDETLRKYPVIPVLKRKCGKDYKMPGTDLVIEKDTLIFISIYSMQRDPEYFPEPDRFDPDRFSEENKKNIKPFTYLPFGDGPRQCIGIRFGIMQVLVGLVAFLKTYKVKLNSKTQIPLEYDPDCIVLTAQRHIWLDVEKFK